MEINRECIYVSQFTCPLKSFLFFVKKIFFSYQRSCGVISQTPKSMGSSNSTFGRAKLKRKAAGKNKSKSLRYVRFSGPFHHQNWPFPDSMIYYILKNPISTKVYQKMIQTCKFFYCKNPIAVFPKLISWHNSWNQHLSSYNFKSISAKWWITHTFEMRCGSDIFLSSLIPRIYRSDIKWLILHDQNISWSDFSFLSSTAEMIHCSDSVIKEADGTEVLFEKVVAAAPKIKTIF